jgi:hypothetical protein
MAVSEHFEAFAAPAFISIAKFNSPAGLLGWHSCDNVNGGELEGCSVGRFL